MLKLLLESPAVAQLKEIFQKERSLLMERLWDTPKAALILLASVITQKNILVITGEGRENRLLDDFDYFGECIPSSAENSTFDKASAPGLEQAKPASKQPMCKHMGDADGCKDGDAGAAKSEVFSRTRYQVFDLPSWETLPDEEISPSPDIVGKRYQTLLALLAENGPKIVICPLQACLQKMVNPKTLRPLCHTWKKGTKISFDDLSNLLTSLGYRKSPVAADKGEFALRGGILDIFPLASPDPYRIEFFGDEIDEIRTYDPIGQKSIAKAESVFICPGSELELLKSEKNPSLLLDYLGEETLVIFDDLLSLEDRYVSLKGLKGSSSRLLISFEEFFKQIKRLPHFFWTKESAEELSDVQMDKKVGSAFYSRKEPLQPLSFSIFNSEVQTKRWRHPFQEIPEFFAPTPELLPSNELEILTSISRFAKSALSLHFITSTDSEEKSLRETLKTNEILLPKDTVFERGYLSSGFALTDCQLAFLPMAELTGRLKIRRQKWRSTYHTPASDFHELEVGDYVVHFQNGIGKYLGVEKKLNHLNAESEFMVIAYAESGKLYVPISQSHLISRYIGSKEETPTLSVLGSGRWQKTKLNAEKAILGYAKELLDLNAARVIQGGFHFPNDGKEFEEFENDFPFVATEDQLNAIEAIKKDMCSDKAMDRLVCGDVGYGKTEVAMRAAFKAVADGKKQVAVLVPTTVLALQHFETFKERMANYPINVGMVSRFVSAKETKDTLKKTAEGKIDILIGTHRMVSKDVVFKDLGLIIIDEEQRFGVRAKEHLKKLKAGVDCLTLSATPIPRTLYLSLIGAKEISLINTPPQDRLPVKTFIAEREESIIQNALLRELSREGQAFFIHNRVESLPAIESEIQKLLPEARVVSAHGQMSSDEIDAVFHVFKKGDADILIATTIVENGIDIPNANTILIDRAHQFGLADLYQLRGRVGRWNRPAYAYFLVPVKRELPELVRKRMHALVEASGFGGGMKIAMRDLEIRGAGDILGTQQSGQISAIGFHLYCKLLKRAVSALKSKIAPNFTETKMEFGFNAKLPEDYVSETSLRLEIYHRLGAVVSLEDVDAILSELKDRFGPVPEETLWLYHLTRIRVFATARHFTLLKFETRTFTADQQKRKETTRKTLTLPKAKNPKDFEKEVFALLDQNFSTL